MYNTPELKLVGAARTVVLGTRLASEKEEQPELYEDDFDVIPYTDGSEQPW
jgi:hypothetical protein